MSSLGPRSGALLLVLPKMMHVYRLKSLLRCTVLHYVSTGVTNHIYILQYV